MADDRARVIAWLSANPAKGYKRCARELGLDVEQVTAWGKEHRGSGSVMQAPPARARDPEPPQEPADRTLLPEVPVAPAGVDKATWRARLTEIDYALVQQDLLERAIDLTLEQEKFNTAGLAALIMRASENKAHLLALVRERPDELSGLSAVELRDAIATRVRGWPDDALEAVLTEYSRRHSGRILLVSTAGRSAEWDADEQVWRVAK